MKSRYLWSISVLLMVSLFLTNAQAQEEQQPKPRKSFKERLIHYLDSSNVMGTDPDYIGLPKKKWCVMVNSSHDQLDLRLESHVVEDANNMLDFRLEVMPPVTNSIGLGFNYRGWGGGYGISLTGNKGINMSFNIATPSNGVNIRWRRFDFDTPQLSIHNVITDGVREEDDSETVELNRDMRVESFVLDGYWIFNSKRFALAAPYGQSVIQKRSAGSLIAGLMLYYQRFDMSQRENAVISLLHNGLGKLKIYQGSIGAGYTYNWVPTPGLVVNAVAMPVVSVVNYMKTNIYTYKLDIPEEEALELDGDEMIEHITLDESTSHGDWGKIRLNLDVRASITYWIRNWYITGMGQIHSFSSSYDETKIRMSEWDLKTAIGFTF